MGRHDQVYICPTCKSRKTIVKKPHQSVGDFQKKVPLTISCGYRGCTDQAVLKIGE